MFNMPKRCAFGCENTGNTMHVFPNPDKFPERFTSWVSLTGGKLENPTDYAYYKKKLICDIHFEDIHRNRFKRLNALAVPTLYLHGHKVSSHSETVDAFAVPSTSGVNTHSEMMDVFAEPPTSAQQYAAEGAKVQMEHNYSLSGKSHRKTGIKGATLLSGYTKFKPLQSKIKYLQSEICRLRKKNLTYRQRLSKAEKLCNNVAFERVVKDMTKPARLFVHMQQQSVKKPKGRRFSIEEKVLSLSLFKKSPKCYRLLYKYFALPSSRAMKRLLCQVKLSSGINNIIFDKIKKNVANMDVTDRLCSLMFDEMSITPQIFYNAQKGQFDGFASNKKNSFADHALVFMVKGVKQNFKQPVAYYFTNGLNKHELKSWIKCIIQKVTDCGLIIVNTVCDQSTVNVGAITELVNETKAYYLRKNKECPGYFFIVTGKKIIPLYDTPHIIKCLRNNLITKYLLYTTAGVQKLVKWEYYKMIYAADKSYGELRLLDKITEEHVNPEKIRKMRVKTATQLFSHSVAVVAEHLTARGDLPQECRNLVDITLLIDNVFDSLNCSSFYVPNGKIFKGPVKHNSPHHQLWNNAKNVIKTIKYVKPIKTGDKIRLVVTVVPTIKNFIQTIEGMESLWKVLSSKYGLDVMLTRNFNQDPIENFFGNIRSYGARNIAPNTVAFEGAFKAFMLNNFNTPHSNGANCEEDSNECLQNLDFFLKEKINTPDVAEESIIHFNNEMCLISPNEDDAGQGNYVCGWVLKKCLSKIVKKCKNCRLDLLDSNGNNKFIKAKEYQNKNWLCYPSKNADIYFKELQKIIISFLKKLPKHNVSNTIKSFIEIFVDCPFKCEIHRDDLKKYFVNVTINVIIYSWCRSVNRILSGKIAYAGDDETKVAAQNYYNKHKHYKNKK